MDGAQPPYALPVLSRDEELDAVGWLAPDVGVKVKLVQRNTRLAAVYHGVVTHQTSSSECRSAVVKLLRHATGHALLPPINLVLPTSDESSAKLLSIEPLLPAVLPMAVHVNHMDELDQFDCMDAESVVRLTPSLSLSKYRLAFREQLGLELNPLARQRTERELSPSLRAQQQVPADLLAECRRQILAVDATRDHAQHSALLAGVTSFVSIAVRRAVELLILIDGGDLSAFEHELKQPGATLRSAYYDVMEKAAKSKARSQSRKQVTDDS